MKKRVCVRAFIFTFIITLSLSNTVFGQAYIPTISPSVILVEQSTGKVLFSKNEYQRMYPASLTKILTALVAVEYMDPDEVVVVGGEIYNIPADYVTNVHTEGESVTVRNLLRALMIRSGNETGCVLALNTIRKIEERRNIPYGSAEELFCNLMNEKARALGALDSNFTNTYGLHEENHYTTAYDLALICRAYMENELLRSIAAEREYTGESAEGKQENGASVSEYSFTNHNLLLLPGDHYYPYATGIKTGFHDDAGDCLAAAGTRDGLSLVAVIFNSPEPGRWQDAKMLMEYAFNTFSFQSIHSARDILAQMTIANPRLGETETVDILAGGDVAGLLSEDEIKRMERTITYKEEYISADNPEALAAPFEKDAEIGEVTYVLDGETFYIGTVLAAAEAMPRTSESDVDYYIGQVKDNIFTMKAFPYWFGVAGFLVGIIGIAVAVASRRKNRRDHWRGSSFNRFGGYKK
jgi:D-alanyl-D-alanine carboxypeptidase (penicillin-binding protein 5/6)